MMGSYTHYGRMKSSFIVFIGSAKQTVTKVNKWKFLENTFLGSILLPSPWVCPAQHQIPCLEPESPPRPTHYGTDYLFFFFFFLLFLRAILAAYGSSQARGQIRAVAAGLHHSSQQ